MNPFQLAPAGAGTAAGSLVNGDAVPVSRPRLLLVDDSEPIHRLVRAWLRDQCEVASARNGREAIQHSLDAHVDLILLDVDMPEMDGFECCRLLKGDPRTAHVPIVFLTGATTVQEKVRGLAMGAVDYVTKPFNPAEFLARVHAALRTKALMDNLANRSRTDALTGLRSRAYVEERVPALVSQAKRNGRVFSCLALNVDGFKQANDRLGHAGGDAALQRIGAVLRQACRTEDIVCRADGDAFIILMPDVGECGASSLAARLLDAMRAERFGAGTDGQGGLALTMSMGVAEHDLMGCDDVIRRAEEALRDAKRQGRNCHIISTKRRDAA